MESILASPLGLHRTRTYTTQYGGTSQPYYLVHTLLSSSQLSPASWPRLSSSLFVPPTERGGNICYYAPGDTTDETQFHCRRTPHHSTHLPSPLHPRYCRATAATAGELQASKEATKKLLCQVSAYGTRSRFISSSGVLLLDIVRWHFGLSTPLHLPSAICRDHWATPVSTDWTTSHDIRNNSAIPFHSQVVKRGCALCAVELRPN